MDAPLKQPLRTELMLSQSRDVGRAAARRLGWVIGAFGFCCLMPYVAIPVGNRSAIQIGNLLTLILVMPVVLLSWKKQPFWIYPLLIAPLCISTFKVSLVGGDVPLAFKAISLWAFSMLPMLPTQLYGGEYSLEMLTGIAIAAIVHTLVGIWQWKAFASGYFPLEFLFENQSFLSVKDNADTIAKYTQRPFGIFPEPSAMSSSLAPWVLFWLAELFGLIRLKRKPAKWQRVLFGAAASGALGLIILSRSGHAMITLAVVSVMAAVWFVRCRATLKNFMAIVAVCWVALPVVLVLAAIALSDRMGGGKMGNSSWADRSHSLLIGAKLLLEGGPLTLLLGVGVGQTSPVLQKVYGLEAIWSVSLVYIYETGFIGLVVLAAVVRHYFRIWKTARFGPVFIGIASVWIVGVTLTTSYQQLLSLWVVLGWLSIWPRICETPAPRQLLPQASPQMQPAIRRLRWSDMTRGERLQ